MVDSKRKKERILLGFFYSKEKRTNSTSLQDSTCFFVKFVAQVVDSPLQFVCNNLGILVLLPALGEMHLFSDG